MNYSNCGSTSLSLIICSAEDQGCDCPGPVLPAFWLFCLPHTFTGLCHQESQHYFNILYWFVEGIIFFLNDRETLQHAAFIVFFLATSEGWRFFSATFLFCFALFLNSWLPLCMEAFKEILVLMCLCNWLWCQVISWVRWLWREVCIGEQFTALITDQGDLWKAPGDPTSVNC